LEMELLSFHSLNAFPLSRKMFSESWRTLDKKKQDVLKLDCYGTKTFCTTSHPYRVYHELCQGFWLPKGVAYFRVNFDHF
jgi:hypothetical protein